MERGDISGGGETKQNNSGQQQQQPQPPAQQCPRCESVNTKFCYYNNYSLSQPRYFCKTCRRYWTQGGTLRNVPVGGGCRKGKRAKTTPSSATASPPSITTTTPPSTLQNHHQFLSSSNLPHHQSQYMMSGVGSTNPGLGSFYPGTAGFLNALAAIPNQSLITGSTSSNLGFGAVTAPPFPATQYFGSNNYPRQEENLMMSFPNWQRSEEEYDVRATATAAAVAGGSRNMVPETALWSISTSTTTGESVRAEEGKNDNAGGGSSLMNGLQDDRRWNHGGGGGGGQLPGYGPS